MKTEPKKPRVTVRQKAEVCLSREEVEHCLRCWLSNKLVPIEAPKERSLNDVLVTFEIVQNEHHEPQFDGVTLTYEPASIDVTDKA